MFFYLTTSSSLLAFDTDYFSNKILRITLKRSPSSAPSNSFLLPSNHRRLQALIQCFGLIEQRFHRAYRQSHVFKLSIKRISSIEINFRTQKKRNKQIPGPLLTQVIHNHAGAGAK